MGIVLYGLIEILERVLIPWHLPSDPMAPMETTT
jgi:hypothetical protein